ncbi:aldo/keto reductase [Streptomyces tsukubensis]|uniref:Aldo/keto reductase n=1 Tax=Streptomyces tsukubensis TaxID=83656 RepID=A0A1V3ZYW3_9ACTN|nr:aldo/keto reductase [Streptomyces tsukubensis]OON71317.1 aldo/keto reductase [Streptomyces tsukubensis]QFR96791.1 aldo/keto reductase [Streptomyces tsukubensis]
MSAGREPLATDRLGRSGLSVTTLGFGAASVGGLYAPLSDDAAHATLQAAWDEGIRYFDTAPHYGVGLSEERVGRFLAGKPRDSYVLSTKVGRLLIPYEGPAEDVQGVDGFHGTPKRTRVTDYSGDGIRRSLDESLTRLGLDRVDIVHIHDPDDHAEQALDESYPALEELRGQGVISSIGVGMNQTAVPARFVRDTDIDCLLIAGRYTLLDTSASNELFPLCLERGVDVVGAGAFNSGLLAAPEPGARFDYAEAPEPMLRAARGIAEVCARHGVAPAAAALAFTGAHPAVRTVLAGMRTAQEVRQNALAARTEIPRDLWSDLAAEGLLPTGAHVPAGRAPGPGAPTETPTRKRGSV